MKIEEMKIRHWAHEWPEEYLDAIRGRYSLSKCENGHSDCSMCDGGPCREDIERRLHGSESAT